MNQTAVFEDLESNVRFYCREWPVVFETARGSYVYGENTRGYLDFFAGAGALNYGHNHPELKAALLGYLERDAIVHGLDMYTTAKREFIEAFRANILAPRGLDYKLQFPGPAGTIAVEAALKLARKSTGRNTAMYFTNAFHGMTLGALAVSRLSAGHGLADSAAVEMPYGHSRSAGLTSLSDIRDWLHANQENPPGAMIVEMVQGEGGIYVADADWVRGLAAICQTFGMLLIVDDIQMGCGRSGSFFSFEKIGIQPDIVCLSKSLSGYGLPFALLLLRPELDVWQPGEHSGTFRGFSPAFVTGAKATRFWLDEKFEKGIVEKSGQLEFTVRELAARHEDAVADVRGLGMVWGIVFRDPLLARKACGQAFERGLLVETTGARRDVMKLMPPLTTSGAEIERGMELVDGAIRAVLAESS
jgi:diaminobutyrate-2-oxoglutarate transaminase